MISISLHDLFLESMSQFPMYWIGTTVFLTVIIIFFLIYFGLDDNMIKFERSIVRLPNNCYYIFLIIELILQFIDIPIAYTSLFDDISYMKYNLILSLFTSLRK